MILNNLNFVQLGHYVVPQTFFSYLMDGWNADAGGFGEMQCNRYAHGLKWTESEKWGMRNGRCNDETLNKIEFR